VIQCSSIAIKLPINTCPPMSGCGADMLSRSPLDRTLLYRCVG